MKTLFAKTLLFGGLAGSLVLGGCGDNKEELKEIPKKEISGTIIAEYESREYANISKNPQLIEKSYTYKLVTENNDTFMVNPTFTSNDIFNIGDKVKLQTEDDKTKRITLNDNGEAIPSNLSLNIVSYEIKK